MHTLLRQLDVTCMYTVALCKKLDYTHLLASLPTHRHTTPWLYKPTLSMAWLYTRANRSQRHACSDLQNTEACTLYRHLYHTYTYSDKLLKISCFSKCFSAWVKDKAIANVSALTCKSEICTCAHSKRVHCSCCLKVWGLRYNIHILHIGMCTTVNTCTQWGNIANAYMDMRVYT